MDILSFINSKSIREYLKEIKYEFNTLEAAWIVNHSICKTIKEKHEAWEEILKTMPDCEMPGKDLRKYKGGIHYYIKEVMKSNNKYLDKFFLNEDNAIYQFKYCCDGDNSWTEKYHRIFKSFDECWNDGFIEDFEEDYRDINLINRIKIRKIYFGNIYNYIEIDFNVHKEPIEMDHWNIDVDDECDFSFDELWFNFPTPFKKGDVVIPVLPNVPESMNRGAEWNVFVLVNLITWNKEYIERYDPYNRSGSDNMGCEGYFQDPDGRIFGEGTGINYMDLEYYEGDYSGVDRLLKAIGAYIKDEIGLDLLLSAYRKVILDEFTNDIMLSSWYSDEYLEKAGLRRGDM